MTPRKKKLKTHIRVLASKIKRKSKTIAKLKTRVANSKNIFLNLIPFLTLLSAVAKTFILMQFRGKRRHVWKKDEKEFCISFFYKSPSAYLFLRKKGIILPSVSTIRRWISSSLFKTGLDKSVERFLKLKSGVMTKKEKTCVVSFDEISLKQNIEYNKKLDMVEGFQDLGPLGRIPKQANHALVFSIRGLYTKWKMPLAYFFSYNSVQKDDLKKLIEYVLDKIIQIGLIPRLVVCDQGSNNRGALSLLGVTTEKPYFFIKDTKIISIFDVPHLFKSIRNNLISGTFKLEDKIIDFDVIKKTFKIDQSSNSARALPKITEKHINPDRFQKMSCSLALQIFSKTMAAAIKTCVQNGQVNKKEGIDTSEFILTLNNLFDALNSKRLFDKNPFRCGLSDKNNLILEILQSLY